MIAGRADLDGGAAAALGADADRKVRRVLAENPATPADVLITLIGDADFSTRWSAAQNPSADAGVHRAALAGTHEDTAEAIGQLGDLLPAAILETVLVHPHRQARWQLALSTSSPQVLQRLAVDPAPEVRATVAQSNHAGQVLLCELATDTRAEVRAVAAAAASMPREVLEELARDRSVNVRFWVTANTQYDEALAQQQADDPNEHIRRHAQVAGDRRAVPLT